MNYIKYRSKFLPTGQLFDNMLKATFSDATENHHASFHVPVNIYNNEAGFVVELFAPGFNKEDLSITIEKNLLTISGEVKKGEKKEFIRNEFSPSSFKRTFTIDETKISSEIQAKYENGVLTLNLPRKVEVKEETKKITVL